MVAAAPLPARVVSTGAAGCKLAAVACSDATFRACRPCRTSCSMRAPGRWSTPGRTGVSACALLRGALFRGPSRMVAASRAGLPQVPATQASQ